MKESGMEKLIELLNEYNKEIGKPKRMSEREVRTHYSWVICSGYGFIKWLVQNDKIDFSWEGKYCEKSIEVFDGLLMNDEDSLIMILSVSDTPIDDLISYLK